MWRKRLAVIFATVLLIALVGCGYKNLFTGKDVPPLEGYSTVILTPLDIKKPSGQYEGLPTMLSYSIGTKLSVRLQDNNWLFDQSEKITPVSDKLKELNLSLDGLYQDPQAAAKLAESLQGDLVITGKMEEPRFDKEESGKIVEDRSEMTQTGTARYYMVLQTAILKADLRIVDVKSTQTIWEGRIVGYKKYETLYRTGAPKKSQREETMLADVRRDFVQKFVDTLYPVRVASGE